MGPGLGHCVGPCLGQGQCQDLGNGLGTEGGINSSKTLQLEIVW